MTNQEAARIARTHEDMTAVLNAYKRSVSAPEVSRQTGIPKHRVLFVIEAIQLVINLHANRRATPLGLSVRTLNALGNHSIATKAEARMALESGVWKKWRNFGVKSSQELKEFLEDGLNGPIC